MAAPGAPATASNLAVQGMLLAAMAIWGVNLSAVKALTSSLDLMVVATSRMLVALAMLSLLVAPGARRLLALDRRRLAGLAVCALLMVYANQILFASGLARTTATNAAIVMACTPLVSSLVAAVLLREPAGWRRIVGIAVGFAGVAVVILNRQGAGLAPSRVGDLLLLSSVLCFAIGGAMVQRLSRGLSALEVSWVVHAVGVAMLCAHVWLGGIDLLTPIAAAGPVAWALIAFSGIGATALAAIAWNRAIATMGVARTALWFYWVPVFGLAFAAAVLGEPLSGWHGVGLAAVLVGSSIAMRSAVTASKP